MHLVLEGGILDVSESLSEGSLVCLVGYGVVRVTGEVDTVDVVEDLTSLFEAETVVDRDDTDASLLEELYVSLGDERG